MFTQAELEALLTIGFVLVCLAASMDIYWILSSWKREKDHRVEAYVEGLRKLVEGEGSKSR